MNASFQISPRILDHLGVSAYTSLHKCLAELASNCYDADAENVRITLPPHFGQGARIVLEDDGVGMTPKIIKDKYLYVGYNRRHEDGETTEDKQRDVIGNKGIGKLAGFGVANQVEVVSIRDGTKSTVILDKSIFDDFATLSECNIEIITEATDEKSGTTIILNDLTDYLKPLDSNRLRKHLFKTLPRLPDFRLVVNDVPCSADDIDGERHVINHSFDGIGTITGYYIIAKTRQKSPGLIVRVRKRAVTEPSLFGLEKRGHFSFSAEKIVGEINADFLDPYINTSRDNFLEEIEEVQTLKLYVQEYFKNVIDEIEREAEGKRTEKLIEVPDVQEKLNRLPPHIRKKARSVIQGVISKLKSASDEEVDELIDWIIKYFDSNVLRELMKSIMSAEATDVERLSELINEWGLKQMNNVNEIIKGQIEIIIKLEELIDSDVSLEIDVHKLIEGNLWLIREGLELWSSDKPLKNLLEKHFDKVYKDNELERPDLVCRSSGNSNRAVILEFKRPKVKVKTEHVTQALGYQGIVEATRPNLRTETFVVGRQYKPDVLAMRDRLASGGLFLWSFHEILQRTRARFEKILEILGDN